MKIIISILLIILGITFPLKSDILHLNNGEMIAGQLLEVTSAGLIFEIRAGLIIQEYRTFPCGDVLQVIDDYGTMLFENNQLKVEYLSDYYNRLPQAPSLPFRLDTLYLKDNSILPVYISEISDEFIFYRSGDKRQKTTGRQSVHQVDHINGNSVEQYRQIHCFYPEKRITTFPRLGIEMGYGLISTHLGTLSNLKVDSSITGMSTTETQQFRAVSDNYNGMQVELFLEINPYLSIHALGYYIGGFSGSTVDDYEPERDESYSLAATEVHLTYPEYFIKPWAGLGFAYQSITVISNLEGFDATWRYQSNAFDLSAGLDLAISQTVLFSLSWRSMLFPEKQIDKNHRYGSINPANQVLGGGLKIIF